MDISENEQQIGEKLFALLNEQQQRVLTQYVLDRQNKRVDTSAKVAPDIPDYITSVRGVGYKFNK